MDRTLRGLGALFRDGFVVDVMLDGTVTWQTLAEPSGAAVLASVRRIEAHDYANASEASVLRLIRTSVQIWTSTLPSKSNSRW